MKYVGKMLVSFITFFNSDEFKEMDEEDQRDKMGAFVDFLMDFNDIANDGDGIGMVFGIDKDKKLSHKDGNVMKAFRDLINDVGKERVVEILLNGIKEGHFPFQIQAVTADDLSVIEDKYPIEKLEEINEKINNSEDLTEEEEEFIFNFTNDMQKLSDEKNASGFKTFKGIMEVLCSSMGCMSPESFEKIDNEEKSAAIFTPETFMYSMITYVLVGILTSEENNQLVEKYKEGGIVEVFNYLADIADKIMQAIFEVFNDMNLDFSSGVAALLFLASGVSTLKMNNSSMNISRFIKDMDQRKVFDLLTSVFAAFYGIASPHNMFSDDKLDQFEEEANDAMNELLVNIGLGDGVYNPDSKEDKEESDVINTEIVEENDTDKKPKETKVTKSLKSMLIDD